MQGTNQEVVGIKDEITCTLWGTKKRDQRTSRVLRGAWEDHSCPDDSDQKEYEKAARYLQWRR